MCNEYNGYKNYQTWNVALWLDNEQGTNEMLYDLANNSKLESNYANADLLKEYVEACAEPILEGASMFSDLLGHALANVDYLEIIETHKEN